MGEVTGVGRRCRALAVVVLCSAVTLTGASAAWADDQSAPPDEPEEGVTDQMLAESVRTYDVADHVQQFSVAEAVKHLGGTEPEEDDVIVLETDILFAAMEWELPDSAGSKIAELVEEIPEGAAVDVGGHTDSNPVPDQYDFDNQVLSENRAEAVAEVLADERGDLELTVEGFGEDQPAVEEDEEDPSTFAANRRVEIRYD